jgi:hypothetical protein
MPDVTLQGATRSVLGVSQAPNATPESIAAGLYPPDSTNIKQAGKDAILAVCRNGNIPPYTNGGNGGCNGANTGVGTQLANVGLNAAGQFLGPLAFITGIFGAIFQHHAGAVLQENKVLCQAVPSAQQFFAQIDQGVASGQLSYADAASAMEQAFQQFSQGVSSIIKMDASHCNASCYYVIFFRAAIEKRKLDYQLSAATLDKGTGGYSDAAQSGSLLGKVSASLTSAFDSVNGSASAAAPNWLLIGGVIVGGLVLISIFRGGRS